MLGQRRRRWTNINPDTTKLNNLNFKFSTTTHNNNTHICLIWWQAFANIDV